MCTTLGKNIEMSLFERYLRNRTKSQIVLDRVSAANHFSFWGVVVLVLLYAGSTVFLRLTSASEGVFFIGHQPIPHRSVTGAFSAICNLCLILMIVLYKKPGYIIAASLTIAQLPGIVINMAHQNYTSISGLVTNVVIFITISILYTFVSRSNRYLNKIRDQAITDRLTGLPNRFAITELMKYLIQKKESFALAVIKFNYFDKVNNTLGQQAGDEALVQIANRLRNISEEGSSGTKDFVATRKGNDFLLIVREYASEAKLRKTIEFYADAMKKEFIIENCSFNLSTSIGYATYPTDTDNADTVFDYAYKAMTQARKTDTAGFICRFTKDMLKGDNSVEIERYIRSAIDKDEVHYQLQPQYDASHKLRGFEALARIRDDKGKPISPVDFIPVAEKAGLVEKIDHSVLYASTKFVGDIVKKTKSDLILSVNASVRHLLQNGFVDEIKGALKKSGLPANQLEIEITESIMIDSVEKALDCIKQISALGVRIAIDDFGTGYSSLSYLNTFPADVIKIDRSFIINMNSSETSKQYVAAIIAIGHVMNFQVIAEGVEESDQVETLQKIGCDFIQGFYWGKPLDPEEAAKLV